MKKNTKTPHFDVDFKQRLEQQRKAKNTVRLPKLGYAPYRVYEIEQSKDKQALNGMYGSGTGGKSSFNMSVSKSRQSGKSNWQQMINDLQIVYDILIESCYEVKWLKEKQATMLRLQGHTVEPTTPDDESTVGPVKVGM